MAGQAERVGPSPARGSSGSGFNDMLAHFPSLESLPITFPEPAISVGKNDVGKSSVLDARQLLLGGEPLSSDIPIEDSICVLRYNSLP